MPGYFYLTERRDKCGLAVAPSLLAACDEARPLTGAASRNDFAEQALRYFLSELHGGSEQLHRYLICDQRKEIAHGKYTCPR